MAEARRNRVRELRERRGLSQGALASAVNLTRQSIHAIEAGRAIPGVDVALRLSEALDCTVDVLFGAAPSDGLLSTECVAESARGRVALSFIAGRWVSYPLERESIWQSADALVAGLAARELEVEPLRAAAECRENVVLMGCAPALGLLADKLNSHRGPGHFLWFTRSSTSALQALGRRQTHLAGVHLIDAASGEANVPDVRRHAGDRAITVITLARWEAGFVVAAGNPQGIRGAAELANAGIRVVRREPGSGAQHLLERELQNAGIDSERALASAVQAFGHLDVARAIALGVADVGPATRDAALAFGLDFIAIAEERYDLALPSDELSDPRLARLFEVMTSAAFRRELRALGYDATDCGERVAEVSVV
ncbi:MAG TPA: substrate-binding domain-containing protein [Polyangiaceae bacterium]|nr:substrate-binding domain-containing protein [Polyangiaceae bacterium]